MLTMIIMLIRVPMTIHSGLIAAMTILIMLMKVKILTMIIMLIRVPMTIHSGLIAAMTVLIMMMKVKILTMKIMLIRVPLIIHSGLIAAMTCVYDLTAVLIHRGPSAHSGHYIAHIQDTVTKLWFRFNDEDVTAMKGRKLQLGKEEEVLPGGRNVVCCLFVVCLLDG